MSRKLKKQSVKTKIGMKLEKRGRECEQYPTFSFYYLTTNSTYNFNFFKNSQSRDKSDIKENLYDRIEEITKHPWRYWLQQRKNTGCESFEFSRLQSLQPNRICLPQDESIYIFRFDTLKREGGRIIGFRKDKCPIYYIIGYDFNFSAYNHG